ncbi:Oligopeptide transport system permease protein OppC [Anaerolineae bacterium]|nr:Oligopeptide transport system permease protein OppC [Anaerolineae bacterium]
MSENQIADVLGSQLVSKAEERVSVASNWQLVWWRFRKNRLALVATALLIAFYVVVLAPDFFSTQDPEATEARLAYIPMQGISFFDETGFRLTVPAVAGKRNPVTLRMEWQIDATKKIPIGFFVKGYKYKLLGLFETDLHLLGTADPKSEDRLYLLGTDRLGRDQWSRLTFGTRTSMTVGLVAVALSVILGILLGGASGYFGGWIDLIIQRLIELLQSLPTIPIWLAMTAALPTDWRPDQVFFAITVILSFIGWTTLAREVRGRFLSLREEDFVLAADLAGCSRFRIITRHMVPAFMSHIIATSTLAIPAMIISETTLSYLGLGIRPPAISWGVLLQEAQNIQTIAQAPWLLLPGVFVILAALAFNLVGDGLRDAADPYGH